MGSPSPKAENSVRSPLTLDREIDALKLQRESSRRRLIFLERIRSSRRRRLAANLDAWAREMETKLHDSLRKRLDGTNISTTNHGNENVAQVSKKGDVSPALAQYRRNIRKQLCDLLTQRDEVFCHSNLAEVDKQIEDLKQKHKLSETDLREQGYIL